MAFSDILTLFATNLGTSIEALVILITFLGSLLFMANDVRIGLIIMLLAFACEFVIFYTFGMDTLMALTATLITLIALTLSIYLSYNRSGTAVF